MLKKTLSIFIAAGLMAMGISTFAAEEKKENTIQTREQVRVTERIGAEVKASAPSDEASQDADLTRDQDRTRLHDQKKDGTGDQDRDMQRDRDRIHKQTGTGAGMNGNMGSQGMGGGRR
jgi:hypothetical protein